MSRLKFILLLYNFYLLVFFLTQSNKFVIKSNKPVYKYKIIEGIAIAKMNKERIATILNFLYQQTYLFSIRILTYVHMCVLFVHTYMQPFTVLLITIDIFANFTCNCIYWKLSRWVEAQLFMSIYLNSWKIITKWCIFTTNLIYTILSNFWYLYMQRKKIKQKN